MKSGFVAALIRLYPSRWRAEYGDELAEVLLRRPLGPGGVANVAANAVWQQLRMQEPWRIMGALALVWVVMYLSLVVAVPGSASRVIGKPTVFGVAIFFGVGLWTNWRLERGSAAAAIKLSLLVSLPFLLFGLIALAHPGLNPAASGVGTLQLVLTGSVLQIPYAGLIGWCGGLAGHLARRVRRAS